MDTWFEVATSINYSAQMCLMGWFLTLSSKMTGFKIPGIQKMLMGGRTKNENKELAKHLSSMKKIAKAMYDKNHWN